jgi:hypothetical protein
MMQIIEIKISELASVVVQPLLAEKAEKAEKAE